MDGIIGTLSEISTISGRLSAMSDISGKMTAPERITPDIYDGEYVFTPSLEEQEIQIDGMMASQNIIIEPIPSNYGRIEWNGSTLTVS